LQPNKKNSLTSHLEKWGYLWILEILARGLVSGDIFGDMR
jgi:hypothetical protein